MGKSNIQERRKEGKVMRRANHIAIGYIAATVLGVPVVPAMIGSIIPDIDTAWSLREGKRGKGGLIGSHRGITHHLLLGILLVFLSVISGNIVFISFAAGYVSHLFADILTISGIPYWKNKDRIALRLFKTGSIWEDIFVLSLAVVVFTALIKKGGIVEVIPRDVYLLVSLAKGLVHI